MFIPICTRTLQWTHLGNSLIKQPLMILQYISRNDQEFYHWYTIKSSLSITENGHKRELSRYLPSGENSDHYIKEGRYLYVTRSVIIRYLTSSECKVREDVLEELANNRTIYQILEIFFELQPTVHAVNNSCDISDAPQKVSVEECHTTEASPNKKKRIMDPQITEMRKKMKLGFSHAESVDEFLSGPTFKAKREEINLHEYFRLSSLPTNNQIATHSSKIDGTRGYSSNLPTSLPSRKERTRQFLCGFHKICELSGMNLPWLIDQWFSLRKEDFLHFLRNFMKNGGSYLRSVEEEVRSSRIHSRGT